VTGSCEKIGLRTTQARMPVPQFANELNGFRVAQAFLPVLVLDFFTASSHHCPGAVEHSSMIQYLGGLGQW
jgi:hypothetical protein